MNDFHWMKYIFFVCCGLFVCMVICPLTASLGLNILEKLLYILGVCTGAAGCLMPVSAVIRRWSKEQ